MMWRAVIAWTNPVALWALLLAAGPVIVHLLRRHRAARVPFPSLRFVRQAETSAVRVRLPSDPWLLLVRVAAIALAACAAAGPILLTGARLSRWNAITARAIVVDTSGSMSVADADGAVPTRLADDAAQAEARGAAYSRRIESANLADGVRLAAAWAGSAPPARREVVVITDAQRGAFDATVLRLVPDGVGIRVVAVGRRPSDEMFDGAALLGDADRSRRQRVALTAGTTAVTIEGETRTSGVRIVASGEQGSVVARAIDVAARAGSLAPSPEQPIAFRFSDGGGAVLPVAALDGGWMLSVALGVMADRSLVSIAPTDASPLGDEFGRAPWTTLVARDGKPVVSAAALEHELVLQAGAPVDSVFAAAVIRSALNARATSYAEREIATTAPAVLAEWQRAAAPVDPVDKDAWRRATATDARWCWALALAALAIEQWLRRRPRQRRIQENVRAAA
jgi:hypothetical protein